MIGALVDKDRVGGHVGKIAADVGPGLTAVCSLEYLAAAKRSANDVDRVFVSGVDLDVGQCGRVRPGKIARSPRPAVVGRYENVPTNGCVYRVGIARRGRDGVYGEAAG